MYNIGILRLFLAKMLLKKKRKKKKKPPAPFTFEQTLADPPSFTTSVKSRPLSPPPHTHTRTHKMRRRPPLSAGKNDKRFIRSICLPASSPSLGIPDFHSQPSRHNKNSSHVSCSACWFSLKTVILNLRVQMENSANPRFTLCRCNPWMGFPCLQ